MRGFAGRRPAPASDRGFTLIEVVVAMTLFAVAATAILGLLVNTADVARGNLRRSTAGNLVQQKIEAVRALQAVAIPDSVQVTTQTIGATTYTITQTSKYVPTDSSTNVCQGADSMLAYKLVTVTVTWPDMGSIKPVRADTLKAVGLGDSGATTGSLAAQVWGTLGGPETGVTVTLTSSTGGTQTMVTGDDGCVVFASLPTAATYSVSASTSGYTDPTNTGTATATGLGVSENGITRQTLYYDSATSLDVALDAPAGAQAPNSGLGVRIGSSYVTESPVPTCPSTGADDCATGTFSGTSPGTVTLNRLYPAVYSTVKVGVCNITNGSSQSIDLRTPTSTTASVTIPVAVVTVIVKKTTNSTYPVGRDVAIASTVSGCTSEIYHTTSVGTAGGVAVILPYGSWKFSSANGTSTPQVTVNASTKTATVTIGVSS